MLKRLLWAIPTLLGAVTLVFLIMNVLPGDIAEAILSAEGAHIDPVQLAVLREQLGLNAPLWEQYGHWIWGLIRGDLGTSLWTGQPVSDIIAHRLPYTGSIVVIGVAITAIVAIPIGVLSAVYQDKWPDYILRTGVISGIALPNFWLGMLIMLALVSLFRWQPPLGYATLWTDPWIAAQQLFWPCAVLGVRSAAGTARMLRSTMLEIMRTDYIRTARSKGLKERSVILVHALRNAMLPVVTMFGMEVAYLFSGSVIIETVFNIPGMGLLLISSINHRDIIMVEGIVVVMVVVVMLANLLTDFVYAWIDPKIRYN